MLFESATPEPRITAAIVSYNTRALLAACLESLVDDPRLEIWVVDNGSRDGSAELVRERFPQVRLEAREDNLGFGRAVNLAAARSPDWDWLAVANADTAVEPGALDALLAAAASDPGAGVLAPRLILPDGSTQDSVHPFPSLPVALGYNVGLQRVKPSWGDRHCLESYWDPNRPRRVPWAVGAFLLIRRTAWEAVGGFDDERWFYAEDLDLGWRLKRAGWATRYVPEARVEHVQSASVATVWGSAQGERWIAASYDWMLRHRGWARTRAVAAVNVLGDLARWRGSSRPERRAALHWAWLHTVGLRSHRAIRARLPRPPGDDYSSAT